MTKLRATGITLLALSLGFSPLAMAQGRGDDGGHGRDRGADSRSVPDRDAGLRPNGSSRWDGPRGDGPRADYRRDDRQGNRPIYREVPRGQVYGGGYRGEYRGDYRGEHRGDWRGAGPRHDIYRGGHLPRQYRGHVHVVDDWRGQRLSAPPHGYHWVQTGGDYVLAAIATGVILQILLNN